MHACPALGLNRQPVSNTTAGHRMRPLALDDPATAAAAAAAVAAAAEAGPAIGNGTSDEAGTSGASGSRGRCAALHMKCFAAQGLGSSASSALVLLLPLLLAARACSSIRLHCCRCLS